ncbi:MAG: phosphoglycerate kinase [Candidatus Dasytiphilus stammeri]
MSIMKMTDLDLAGKRVLIRADLNVPIKNGKVTCEKRISAFLPTIEIAIKKGASIMVLSHLGRPTEGKYEVNFSLLPVVKIMRDKISYPIRFIADYLDGVEIAKGEVVIFENVRFNKGERKNDDILSKKYASLCDVFVMDAFGSAHRTQASTHGVIKFSPIACAGPLLTTEVEVLSQAMINPRRPMVAIVGGSKISTKFNILNSLVKLADQVIVGGGIANTFVAIDNKVGQSLYEPDFVESAKFLRNTYGIPIPTDVRVGKQYSENIQAIIKPVTEIKNDEKIMDLGDNSARRIAKILKQAKTILWNGPVGVFEFPNFSNGTKTIANAIAESNAFSIAGGGDTLAAIDLFGIEDKISYISTGGGSFLAFIEGKKLPVITILEERAQQCDITR